MNPARKPIIAGNWKMNTDLASGAKLAAEVTAAVGQQTAVEVVFCPPFPYLASVGKVIAGSHAAVGAQNVYFERKPGAYTGEVSAAMLADLGCKWCIIGHSERRALPDLKETDAFINKKLHTLLAAGVGPILCVGETLAERDGGRTLEVVRTQLTAGLAALTPETLIKVVIAYEPVWAIGTGRTATPDQAQEVHAFIRAEMRKAFGSPADLVRIQYGGSVKKDNAAELLRQPDIDGALVGGASLVAGDFIAICKAAGA